MPDTRVIALLDRPSSRSFGMVPFVEQRSDNSLRVHGLQGRADQTLLQHDLEQLVQDRHALQVDVTVDTPITDTIVAGWLGERFKSDAGGVPHGIPIATCHTVVDEGRFWLADRELVQGSMELWVKERAKDFFEKQDAQLAKLMIWVMPDSDETRAAVYAARKTEKEKQERISWWLRLERDAGRTVTRDELVQRLEDVRSKYEKMLTNRLSQFDQHNVPVRSRDSSPLFRRAA